MRRYHIQKREDYHKYHKLSGSIQQIAHKLSSLNASDPYRSQKETALINKCYNMGLVPTQAKMSDVVRVTPSAFARRRLPVVLVRLRMVETVSAAVKYVEQGHIRVGTETVTDPAYLVTRSLEDFVTWVDTSKIKRNILKYNDKLDDFDLL